MNDLSLSSRRANFETMRSSGQGATAVTGRRPHQLAEQLLSSATRPATLRCFRQHHQCRSHVSDGTWIRFRTTHLYALTLQGFRSDASFFLGAPKPERSLDRRRFREKSTSLAGHLVNQENPLTADNKHLVGLELGRDRANGPFQVFHCAEGTRRRHQASNVCRLPRRGSDARAAMRFAARSIRRRNAWSVKSIPSAITKGDDNRKRFISGFRRVRSTRICSAGRCSNSFQS